VIFAVYAGVPVIESMRTLSVVVWNKRR